jgi:hypothetical protein
MAALTDLRAWLAVLRDLFRSPDYRREGYRGHVPPRPLPKRNGWTPLLPIGPAPSPAPSIAADLGGGLQEMPAQDVFSDEIDVTSTAPTSGQDKVA